MKKYLGNSSNKINAAVLLRFFLFVLNVSITNGTGAVADGVRSTFSGAHLFTRLQSIRECSFSKYLIRYALILLCVFSHFGQAAHAGALADDRISSFSNDRVLSGAGLQADIDAVADGGTLQLDAGYVYEISAPIFLAPDKSITIIGNGATILQTGADRVLNVAGSNGEACISGAVVRVNNVTVDGGNLTVSFVELWQF